MPRFESPYAFVLLVLIPLALWWGRRGRARAAIGFSSTAGAARIPPGWRRRLSFFPDALRLLALVLLVVALARPQMGTERVVDTSRGIAIEMVVDRSSSMSAEFSFRGRRSNRLDAALRLFQDFVQGGDGLGGRPGDLIGVITFARNADTICPLTLAHDAVRGFLPAIRLVDNESEDGTAIGDAVALAAARLQTAGEVLGREGGGRGEYEVKSKVIILLTDGENNAGRRSVEQAAGLAAAWGVRIYAIGIGGEAATTIQTPLGAYRVPLGRGVDGATLRLLAEETGGMFRIAEDAEALRQVYAEIDKLEKSEISSARYTDYREAFTPFALASLALIALELSLACTVFRRIP
jgi:Ca-activated chloride channel family protein